MLGSLKLGSRVLIKLRQRVEFDPVFRHTSHGITGLDQTAVSSRLISLRHCCCMRVGTFDPIGGLLNPADQFY